MTRQEALQNNKNDFGVSKALITLTDSVSDQVLWTIKENSEHGICQDFLDLIYLDSNYQKTNAENYGKFKDIIFDALQTCFTPQTLSVLVKSNEDSGNYYLMYRDLRDHFISKLREEGRTKPALLTRIDDDETYAIIFKEMTELTKGFAPHDPNPKHFVDPCDRKRQINCDKIQERFEK